MGKCDQPWQDSATVLAYFGRRSSAVRAAYRSFIAKSVSRLLDMPVEAVWLPGRYKQLVTARSLICLWAVRELGVSPASLARPTRAVPTFCRVGHRADLTCEQPHGYGVVRQNKFSVPPPTR